MPLTRAASSVVMTTENNKRTRNSWVKLPALLTYFAVLERLRLANQKWHPQKEYWVIRHCGAPASFIT
jgi:hypothetical protein